MSPFNITKPRFMHTRMFQIDENTCTERNQQIHDPWSTTIFSLVRFKQMSGLKIAMYSVNLVELNLLIQ